MVDATIDVVHRGDLLCDMNYALEAHTVAKRSDPNPGHTMSEDRIYNLVIDSSRRDKPTVAYGHAPEQFEAIKEGWG